MPWSFIALLFSFGLIMGSFLNVLIHRMPLSQDVVYKRSNCPSCGALIQWYKNIPLISYLFLRGRCSDCKAKISIRYPLVEIVSGFGCVYFGVMHLASSQVFLFLFYFLLFCGFIVHFCIDLERQLLLDKINLFMLALILPFVILFRPWDFWLLGAAIGFGATYLVTLAFYFLRGQIGLGGGDIKLFGIVGLMVGPVGIVQNIFLSCLLGSIVGLSLILLKLHEKDKPLAFGPFIIIVASFQIFMPNQFNSFGQIFMNI